MALIITKNLFSCWSIPHAFHAWWSPRQRCQFDFLPNQIRSSAFTEPFGKRILAQPKSKHCGIFPSAFQWNLQGDLFRTKRSIRNWKHYWELVLRRNFLENIAFRVTRSSRVHNFGLSLTDLADFSVRFGPHRTHVATLHYCVLSWRYNILIERRKLKTPD